MNIREHLLNSKRFHFKETGSKWHEHEVFLLESITKMEENMDFFINNQIFLGLTDSPLIFLDDLKLDKSNINPDLMIFASRHRSETARPAFLTHTTGNWGIKADFGGQGKQLSRSSAFLLKAGYKSLKKQHSLMHFEQLSDFSLDLEVTHHGPTTLEKPLIFMELGSSKREWKIKEAGRLVARAIIKTCISYAELKNKDQIEIGIGFGGTHYAPNFKRIMEKGDVAISFICPKYHIQKLNKDLVNQMISNTLEKVKVFIIDWKGTNSQDKQHLMPILEDFDIPIKKTKDF